MKAMRYSASAALLTLALTACDNFFDVPPAGVIYEEQLDNETGIEGLVVAAYSRLSAGFFNSGYTTNWAYGDVRSDDAYKGGGGTGDQGQTNIAEQFVNITPSSGVIAPWGPLYNAVARTNQALRRLAAVTEAEFPMKRTREAETRFLRAHFYFLLKIYFNRVPYIDETVPESEYETISNVALSNAELWAKIADDFRFAAENLPESQPQRGRVNRYAATAYLAKVQLYRAYTQNDNHAVTGIDNALMNEVVDLSNTVINSGPYSLVQDFAENFLWETEDNSEVVFGIMHSHSDGTTFGRMNLSDGLAYPMVYGCCGFHQPSQNLVNAFQTDANGLPLFATFNQNSLTDSAHFQTNGIDPRLDHTVGIVGHPFKYDPSFVYQIGWARTPQVYGPYSTMKPLQLPTSPSFRPFGPWRGSSKDYAVIRYAEVLLMAAEALIELGRVEEARPLINQIRERAANSTGRLEMADGSPTANYRIGQYSAAGWDQANARQALRWERRLELAMEGHRFFDLVRWGIAEQVLNAYFEVENTRRGYLANARFTAGKHEYFPIPQAQVDLSKGLYQQNPGY